MSRLFSPGCLYVTPGICVLIQAGADIAPLLLRHQYGDWGDLEEADKAANDRAVRNGGADPVGVSGVADPYLDPDPGRHHHGDAAGGILTR